MSARPVATTYAERKRPFIGRTDLLGYLFISPWLVGFLAFSLLPFVASFLLSFTDWNIRQGMRSPSLSFSQDSNEARGEYGSFRVPNQYSSL